MVALRALLILLALGVPARAQDPIAEWLKQDEVDGQIDEVRPDLSALTDQQLQDIFKIGREQVDNHQLIERGGEDHKPVLYIWVIAIAVGIAAMIAAVKARPLVRTPSARHHAGWSRHARPAAARGGAEGRPSRGAESVHDQLNAQTEMT